MVYYVYINDAVIRHSKYTRKYLFGKTMMRCYPGIENIDVYDALTSDRPYRIAWSHDKTMEYIIDWAGIQFDAGLVEKFTVFIESYQE